jgi:hypothetical protein
MSILSLIIYKKKIKRDLLNYEMRFSSILLLYAKRAIFFQLYLRGNNLHVDDMMTMMSALFYKQTR